jgi:RalA-binding protein 1
MILGLNKDLERALKDKERYRSKLKESLGQLPAGSNEAAKPQTDNSQTSRDAKVPGPRQESVEALVSAGLRGHDDNHHDAPSSPVEVTLAPYPITPPADAPNAKSPSLAGMVEAERKIPTSSHTFQKFDAGAQRSAFEARKGKEVASEVPYNVSPPPSAGLPPDPPRGFPVPGITKDSTGETTSGFNQGQTKFPPPPRKAPPAPLNLQQSNTSAHLHQADFSDDSDSDYDDVLEVEEIPANAERGRRKTREEDDREREVAAARDVEIRSASKKSKSRPSSKSAQQENEKAPEIAEYPVPPRQTVQISPPEEPKATLTAPEQATGSLMGMLSAAGVSALPEGSRQVLVPPMSPGLPLSPRPMGQSAPLPRNPRVGAVGGVASPPMSPRGMGGMPLSPRAPRQPIPLPPYTPLSVASPETKRPALDEKAPMPAQVGKAAYLAAGDSSNDSSPTVSQTRAIYKGFVSDDYPGLLLPPNALPSIEVKVASSRLKPSRASIMFPSNPDEDPVFTLAVFDRSNGQESWRVEKDWASLARIDQQLKHSPQYTAKVPERSLFSGHAPAKIDARRAALDQYFNEVLDINMDIHSALDLCRYLSTNTVEPNSDDHPMVSEGSGESTSIRPTGPGGRPLKSGYLTKRGKNFGGWKARFFVLDGPVFKYYDGPGGAHLGTIKLPNAQIGKQQTNSDNQSPSRSGVDDSENQYRHAFLILEPKRRDSSSLVRHVLCAESDQERDQWVEALLQYVDYRDSEDDETPRKTPAGSISSQNSAKKTTSMPGRSTPAAEADDGLRGFSYEATSQGDIPYGATPKSKRTGTPPPPYEAEPMQHIPNSQSTMSISGPKNATKIEDAGAWGNKQPLLAPSSEDKVKQKKRSFFGFGSNKPRGSADIQDQANDSQTSLAQMSQDQHGPIRAVFGAPLAEAVKYNHPVDVNVELPAVVYRCVEYLQARNVHMEEGIFRLSGSNVVIKALRERFNVEGDVNLITDDVYYDIHAVAGLFKLYLRELPTTILTRDLHLDFLAVTEMHDLQDKIRALNVLVYKLPKVNHELLKYLSAFLINIVNHSEINKMTVRNVGIVFSPTLNIPAPVFALFLQEFDDIFVREPDTQPRKEVTVTVTAPPTTPDDIRSPRKQFFQELPTPSFDQPSFPRGNGNQPNRAMYDTGFIPMQPTYEAPSPAGGTDYGGSLNAAMAGPGPALSYEQFGGGNAAQRYHGGGGGGGADTKAKRRESSMFNMNMGNMHLNKKPSNSRLGSNDSRKFSWLCAD